MTDYRNYQPETTSRIREDIEWSITYSYGVRDSSRPRVLLIGDSICNGYQQNVRELLAEKANITFWASSKCVTDPDYFRELELILGSNRYDCISFNNGLHSLTTNRSEWEEAYHAAVKFIRAKCPDAYLSLTLCTPLNDPEKDAISRALNGITRALAEKEALPVIDLYAAVEKLDKDEQMTDVYHWKETGRRLQAETICKHMTERLK